VGIAQRWRTTGAHPSLPGSFPDPVSRHCCQLDLAVGLGPGTRCDPGPWACAEFAGDQAGACPSVTHRPRFLRPVQPAPLPEQGFSVDPVHP